jgi:hypothetical protein
MVLKKERSTSSTDEHTDHFTATTSMSMARIKKLDESSDDDDTKNSELSNVKLNKKYNCMLFD